MKKFVAVLVLFMVMVAHSALAVEVKQELVKRLYVNNAEFLVSLVECEIEKIDQKRESIELLLSVSVDLQKMYISSKKMEASLRETEAALKKGNSEVQINAIPFDDTRVYIQIYENNISKFKKTIQELHELKKKKLEELKEAKQYLKEAKSIPK
jgi:predicted GTPase